MKLKDAITCDEMRVALREYKHWDSLTHKVFQAAEHQGLSGEDKYVILAYHALRANAQMQEHMLETLRLMPAPPMLIAKAELK